MYPWKCAGIECLRQINFADSQKEHPLFKLFTLRDWDTKILKFRSEKGSTGSTSWICCICDVAEWMTCQLIDRTTLSTSQWLSFLPPHVMLEKKAGVVVNMIVLIVVDTFRCRSRGPIFGALGVAFEAAYACETCADASLAECLFLKTFQVQKKSLLMKWTSLTEAVVSISPMVLVV